MTAQMMWIIVVVAVMVAAVAGFFVGRAYGSAGRRVAALEQEVTQHKDTLNHYKQEVKEHFDHTATLFVSMAGSYKELFEHLSKGYENLADGSVRNLLNARVDTLLQNGPAPAEAAEPDQPSLREAEPAVAPEAASAAIDIAPFSSASDAPMAENGPEKITVAAADTIVDPIPPEVTSADDNAGRVAEAVMAHQPLTAADARNEDDEQRREPSIGADSAVVTETRKTQV